MQQLPKNTRRADYIGIWWTLLGPGGALVTIFSAIIGFFEPIAQYGWSAVVLAGFAAAGVAILIASAGLVGWRYFNPLPNKGAIPPYADPVIEKSAIPTEQQIISVVDARLNEFLATTLRAEFTTHGQMHTHDERLAELADRTKMLRGAIDGSHSHAEAEVKKLNERLEQLIAYTEQRVGTINERLSWVDAGFAAIHNRELHQRMFDELAQNYAAIMEPIKLGQGIADEQAWLKDVRSWKGELEQWLVLANHYAMGASERVLNIPDYLYDGEWTFDESPLNANQVHRYKEAAIWWHNAKEEKPRIDRAFIGAAFHSPSKKGREESPPRPPEDR